jgi:hypothetical protein
MSRSTPEEPHMSENDIPPWPTPRVDHVGLTDTVNTNRGAAAESGSRVEDLLATLVTLGDPAPGLAGPRIDVVHIRS